MILGILGCIIVSFVFAFAFMWPWIAKEIITRKQEQKEDDNPFVDICYCKGCGYAGRISYQSHAHYNPIFKKTLWSCPNCGDFILWEDDVKIVFAKDEEREIERLKKQNVTYRKFLD